MNVLMCIYVCGGGLGGDVTVNSSGRDKKGICHVSPDQLSNNVGGSL